MTTLRLRHIATVGFGASEQTNYDTLVREVAAVRNLKLSSTDVVLLLSVQQNQLVFVHGFVKLWDGRQNVDCLRSARLRLRAGQRWNPLMLVNYAQQLGINLVGLKTFEQHFNKLRKEVFVRLKEDAVRNSVPLPQPKAQKQTPAKYRRTPRPTSQRTR